MQEEDGQINEESRLCVITLADAVFGYSTIVKIELWIGRQDTEVFRIEVWWQHRLERRRGDVR